jgi:hypothetical protein
LKSNPIAPVGRRMTIVLIKSVFTIKFLVVIDFTSKSVVSSMVVPPPPVELITPFVVSIFVPAVKSQDISSPSMVIFVPLVSSFCNPVVEITPSVMFIFVPAVKSQDISSPSMVIFAPVVNSFCLSPIKVETLLPFNNIELVFNEVNVHVPSSSILLNSLLNMFSFVGFLFFKELV